MRIVRESRIERLKRDARMDEQYEALYRKGMALENEMEIALLETSEEVQDAVWAFIFNNEATNDRLLELALEENGK